MVSVLRSKHRELIGDRWYPFAIHPAAHRFHNRSSLLRRQNRDSHIVRAISGVMPPDLVLVCTGMIAHTSCNIEAEQPPSAVKRGVVWPFRVLTPIHPGRPGEARRTSAV